MKKTFNETELKWTPERVSNAIGQDDLYVEMTFARGKAVVYRAAD